MKCFRCGNNMDLEGSSVFLTVSQRTLAGDHYEKENLACG
jgi:hypothetical protein